MPGVLPENTCMSDEIVSGRAAGGDRNLGHGKVETAAAMADVEDHAALLGGQRGRQQLAVLHDIGEDAGHVRRTGISVGQHVARPQQVQNVGHQRAGLDAADMHHHYGRPAAHLAGLNSALERFEAVFEDHVLRHPHLDADQEVLIFRQPHGAGFDLRIVDVVELRDRESRQAVVGDMEKRVHPRPRLRHDVAAQRRKVVDAGIAGRHHGRGALKLHQLVGGNADRRTVGIDVAMQIDQAGHDQFARGVDALRDRGRPRISGSIASITPQRMPMSRLPRSDWLGSSTSPPLITRSNLSAGPIAAPAGVAEPDNVVAAAEPVSARK